MDETTLDLGGYTAITLSVMMWVSEIISKMNVNDILQIIVSILGVVFLVYKIRGQHLDNKIKKKTLRDE